MHAIITFQIIIYMIRQKSKRITQLITFAYFISTISPQNLQYDQFMFE